VVIASLVRSNTNGSVGFLREPERINVLLSRARHGLILLGNAGHLSHAKGCEHWVRLLRTLGESKAILPGLPAVCQVHGTTALLDSQAAFQLHAPQGGCQKMCGQKLACSHTCKLPCHPYDLSHDRIKCDEIVYSYCSKGHEISHRYALGCTWVHAHARAYMGGTGIGETWLEYWSHVHRTCLPPLAAAARTRPTSRARRAWRYRRSRRRRRRSCAAWCVAVT
jgi:hypothetical protein